MKTRIIIAICFILSLSLLSAYDIYGAFRIKTSPRGADVNLYDIDEYLSDTPTTCFPFIWTSIWNSGKVFRGVKL